MTGGLLHEAALGAIFGRTSFAACVLGPLCAEQTVFSNKKWLKLTNSEAEGAISTVLPNCGAFTGGELVIAAGQSVMLRLEDVIMLPPTLRLSCTRVFQSGANPAVYVSAAELTIGRPFIQAANFSVKMSPDGLDLQTNTAILQSLYFLRLSTENGLTGVLRQTLPAMAKPQGHFIFPVSWEEIGVNNGMQCGLQLLFKQQLATLPEILSRSQCRQIRFFRLDAQGREIP